MSLIDSVIMIIYIFNTFLIYFISDNSAHTIGIFTPFAVFLEKGTIEIGLKWLTYEPKISLPKLWFCYFCFCLKSQIFPPKYCFTKSTNTLTQANNKMWVFNFNTIICTIYYYFIFASLYMQTKLPQHQTLKHHCV